VLFGFLVAVGWGLRICETTFRQEERLENTEEVASDIESRSLTIRSQWVARCDMVSTDLMVLL
jgi:hypothetical protein